ncbi:EamA family transporter [Bacillus tianshenii]|nr:EamA family transporter [Bacillus tianshenii]
MDFRIICAHALTILLWGSAFPGIRVGLEEYTPEHLSLLRLLIGSAGLLVFALMVKMKLPKRRDIPAILLLGGLGFAGYHIGLNYGETMVNAGTASVIVSTTPIFAAAFASLFLKDKLSWFGWIGGIVALIGICFISFGSGGNFQFNIGTLFILLGAVSESIYFVFQTNYLKKYGFLPFTTYTIWAGTLWMLIFTPGLWEAVAEASHYVNMTVLYLGIFPTVLPYFAMAYVTSRSGASEATSSLYLTPVTAFLIAWIWLGEMPTAFVLIGALITIIGVLIAHLTPGKMKKESRDATRAVSS